MRTLLILNRMTREENFRVNDVCIRRFKYEGRKGLINKNGDLSMDGGKGKHHFCKTNIFV